MDKHFTKTVLQHGGHRRRPVAHRAAPEWAARPRRGRRRDDRRARLAGVRQARPSRVERRRLARRRPAELAAAMDMAFAEDHKVLVETGVVGREIEIAVLGGRDGVPRTSVAGEIVAGERQLLRLRVEVPRRPRRRLRLPGRPLTDDETRRDPAPRRPRVRGHRRRGARPGRLLPDRRRLRRQRGQHDAGLHADLDVPARAGSASGLSYPELITELIELGRATDR